MYIYIHIHSISGKADFSLSNIFIKETACMCMHIRSCSKQCTGRCFILDFCWDISNSWSIFIHVWVTSYLYSCGSQQSEVADDWHVSTLCGGQSDWPTSERQTTKTFYKIQEQQLVTKVQWNLPFVSVME